MTQQYLAGELSNLLAEVVAAAPAGRSGAAAAMRREAETTAPTALGSVALRALDLTDRLCWESLIRGDTAMFDTQSRVATELFEFAVCADLIDDDVRSIKDYPGSRLTR